MAIKIGDRVKLIDRVKMYARKPGVDINGWFTIRKPCPSQAGWWLLNEGPEGTGFKEDEMIKAKKPTIIIYEQTK